MSQSLSVACLDAAQDPPSSTPWTPGDHWFGRALNELLPRFERVGASLVPGSIDPESGTFEVRNRGQRILVTPRADGDVHARLADDERPASDQFPPPHVYREDEDRHPDLAELEAIALGRYRAGAGAGAGAVATG